MANGKSVQWLIWTTYNSFPKISANKTENRSKSFFVSYFPIFQEMENTWPHEILRGRMLSYVAALCT